MKGENRKLIFLIIIFFVIQSYGCRRAEKSSNGSENRESVEKIRDSQSSGDPFNSNGMNYYKQKKYVEAVKEFRRAIEIEPEHKLANYNLACVYALLYEYCDFGAAIGDDELVSEQEIFQQLAKAIRLDQNIKAKARRDSDFKKLNHHFQFLYLTGLDLNRPGDVKKILTTVKIWYTGKCSMGVYGCDQIIFETGDSFIFRRAVPPCEEEAGVACEADREKTGKFRFISNKIEFIYNDGTKIRYTFPNEQGILDEIDGDGQLSATHPDPCSA